MTELTDIELLRRYFERADEIAFGELVARHVDLVHSAALRQVAGNGALAQEVSQTVFTLLAREAKVLVQRPSIIGWLYTTARYTANHVVRAEHRRRMREHEAHLMRDLDTSSATEWEKLQPLLDASMHQLSESDRDAVLMRYFKRLDFPSVGRELGVTEEAARKRVERALEKLRQILAKQGVTSTCAALGTALSGQAVIAAPIAMAPSITAGVMAASSLAVSQVGLFSIMATTNLKMAVILTVAAAVGTGWIIEHRANQQLKTELEGLRSRFAEAQNTSLRAVDEAKQRETEATRLLSDQAELLRLRGEVGRLRQQAQDTSTAVNTTRVPIKTKPSPPEGSNLDLRDVGASSPEQAATSFVWAIRSGLVSRVSELLELPKSVTDEEAPKHYE
ncbi:MAG TPA: sigma-70 family RNA polymerase sigma factor, partial [Candidatus Limnocylindria bacterium]|nr:sigma-70 family RNA polymerase sigma factor [Candidatus Limnocylindria bacterium]